MMFGTGWQHNKNTVAGINFKMPTEIAGSSSEIKFGGKIQMGTKDRDDDRYQLQLGR